MNILIICQFGASSGILKRKMAEEMADRGIEGSVEAYSIEDLEEMLPGKNIVLVGPQLRINLEEINAAVDGRVPVQLIESVDYGTMNAKNILDKCIPLIQKQQFD